MRRDDTRNRDDTYLSNVSKIYGKKKKKEKKENAGRCRFVRSNLFIVAFHGLLFDARGLINILESPGFARISIGFINRLYEENNFPTKHDPVKRVETSSEHNSIYLVLIPQNLNEIRIRD